VVLQLILQETYKISNIHAFPNIDGVKVRLDCLRNSSIKEDLSTVKDSGFIEPFIG